ncbi:MAG TPA: S41 family peptidase [Cyclobacteriaceae bacterium]|nr:S41 family peptidase [Cyclobacteriaceae bacterium]
MKNKAFLIVSMFVILIVKNSNSQDPRNTISEKFSAKVLIDSLNIALFNNYIFPEKSAEISAHLNKQLEKSVYQKFTDPRKLAEQIQSDINAVHRDGHLRINYNPDLQKELLKPLVEQSGIDSSMLKNQIKTNFSFKRVEILGGNIGYVEFTGFSGFVEQAKPTISSAFRFLSNSDAIIIDLRKNGGGSPWMVKHIASYFVIEKTRLNDIYDRRAGKTGEFWADPEEADNMKLSMPLYILTGKHTFSAAEDFTYAMQVNKRALIVGDTTGGGAHPTGPVSLGQGFVADIPFARSINYITQKDWEGTGVMPDVPVAEDQALIKAQKIIFSERQAKAANEAQKKNFEWFLSALDAHDYDNTISDEVLESYAGEFDNFSTFVKDNRLYLNDFLGRTFLLKPISRNLFLGDDWFQVEFLSESGKVSGLKMLGKAGWEDIYPRTK